MTIFLEQTLRTFCKSFLYNDTHFLLSVEYKTLSYTTLLFSFHVGSVGFQSVPVDNLSHAESPMHDTSPQSPSVDYQDLDHDIASTDDPALVASGSLAETSDMPLVDKNDTDIPDDILLEVHIPLPAIAVVPDPPSGATQSEKPVSHTPPDI